MLAEYLVGNGFRVQAAETAGAGIAEISRLSPDAVILDVMLPDMDGFEALKRIRGKSDVPVLMLTARGDETDRIVGLEIGADDYLPKPFNPRELLARLKAILRRRNVGPGASSRILRFGRLEIDPASRSARVDGRDCPMTSYQFDLLVAFAENAGRTLSREQLMDMVKGEELEAFDRSIDVHVSRIRAAIETDPKHPRRIITVRGAGYVFARFQDDDR
jgi:DNA-binding response OmpR family regulator